MSVLNQERRTGNSTFRWTDLPGELQNRIYDYALLSESPIYISAYQSGATGLGVHLRRVYFYEDTEMTRKLKNDRLAPSLLLVNKQMYKEGCPVLYKNNLAFRDENTLAIFMVRMQGLRPCGFPSPLNYVEHIMLSPWLGWHNHQSLFWGIATGWRILIKCCTNLKTITLDKWDFRDTILDASNLAKYGAFGPLTIKWASSRREADDLVDRLIKVSDRTVRLTCIQELGHTLNLADLEEYRCALEHRVRTVMKRELRSTTLHV